MGANIVGHSTTQTQPIAERGCQEGQDDLMLKSYNISIIGNVK